MLLPALPTENSGGGVVRIRIHLDVILATTCDLMLATVDVDLNTASLDVGFSLITRVCEFCFWRS